MPDPIVWLVLLLPVAAASGWWARARAEQTSDSKRDTDSGVTRDYVSGITHLANDDAERAIETFSRVLAVDDDTVETHLALGNLFRRQGEIDRALKVHQNLITRPQLSNRQRNHARFELACDYLRAGVLDRAERLFGDLSDDDVHGQQSLSRLLGIQEQTREWQSAIQVADRLFAETDETLATLIGQYHCELAEEAFQAGQLDIAFDALATAERAAPNCGRAGLLRGRWHLQAGAYNEAIRAYRRVLIQDPSLGGEIVAPVIEAHRGLEDVEGLLRFFDQMSARATSPAAEIARARALNEAGRTDEAIAHLSRYLQRDANWLAFHALLEYSAQHGKTRLSGPLDSLRLALSRIIATAPSHACQACGFASRYLHWQCPNCRRWDQVRPLTDIGPSRAA